MTTLPNPGADRSRGMRLIAIDALRGLAALGVVFFHALEREGHGARPYTGFRVDASVEGCLRLVAKCFAFVTSFGFAGVWLFFVISGFCIHMRWARARASGAEADLRFIPFWKRRFVRLYPPYFAALLLYLGCRAHDGSWAATPFGLYDVLAHLTMLHNLDLRTTYSIEGAFWTLAIEEQLYLAYFLLLALRNRFGWGVTLGVCLSARVLWFGLGFVAHRVMGAEFVVYESAAANWFVWALGAVAVEAVLGLTELPRWCRRLGPGLLCFSAAVGLTVADRITPAGGMGHHVASLVLPLLWGFGGFWLVNAAVARESTWQQLRTPPLVAMLARFGLMSYSIYLAHDLILIRAPRALLSSWLPTGEAKLVLNHVLLIPLALVGCWLFFLAFERPFIVRLARLSRAMPSPAEPAPISPATRG